MHGPAGAGAEKAPSRRRPVSVSKQARARAPSHQYAAPGTPRRGEPSAHGSECLAEGSEASCRGIRGVLTERSCVFPRSFRCLAAWFERLLAPSTPWQRPILASSHGFQGRSPRFLGERLKDALTCDDAYIGHPARTTPSQAWESTFMRPDLR